MTQDFVAAYIEALEKEGYEYLIIPFKNLNDKDTIVHCNIENLSSDFTFGGGRTISKKESIIELVTAVLEDREKSQK